MLIGGSATLPWTFLGSFLLNVWIGHSAGHRLDEIGVAAAIVIAAASALQAAVGGSVLRRIGRLPDASRQRSRTIGLSAALPDPLPDERDPVVGRPAGTGTS